MVTSVAPPRPVGLNDGVRRRAAATSHAWNVGAVVAINGMLVVALWLRHGGLHNATGPGGITTAAGEVTALVGTYVVLLQLLLMARLPWLEHYVGLDRLAVWHRWNGFAVVWLLGAHVVLTTVGYAAANQASLGHQLNDFVSHYADVLMALVGFGLLLAVAVTSVRAARARLRRETWYFIHLYAYLAIALGFAHQLALGTDFVDDPVARGWWIALHVVVFGIILTWRVGYPLRFNARHRLRVEQVVPEANGTVSIYLRGRQLNRIDVEGGQFFLWRFLTRDGWWQAHPFSLSAAPTARNLRITVKDVGDRSHALQRLKPGTTAFAEGPYGTFTTERRRKSKVLLIAGGIGITPLRAMLDDVADDAEHVTLIYRVVAPGDVAFASELEELARDGRIDLHVITGDEIGDDRTDKLGRPALARLVPDIRARDVFICGPPALLDALRRRLARLSVPRSQVHFERFEF